MCIGLRHKGAGHCLENTKQAEPLIGNQAIKLVAKPVRTKKNSKQHTLPRTAHSTVSTTSPLSHGNHLATT